MGCSLPHSFLPLLSPTYPTPSSPHFCSSTFHTQPHSSTSHLSSCLILLFSPFLFSNHPLPIHFRFSPILFALYIPSLHSSFTFINCIIFYLSLPHPLNPFFFAPSLPSIILPLLTILPLCPTSPLPPHSFLPSYPLPTPPLPLLLPPHVLYSALPFFSHPLFRFPITPILKFNHQKRSVLEHRVGVLP